MGSGGRVDLLRGVTLVAEESRTDGRGWFKHVFQRSHIEAATGAPLRIDQGNHSWSEQGVLRGIHAEPWAKLVYVVSGRAQIVVVNLIEGHDEYGLHMSREVGDFDGGRIAVHVPEGFGNGFLALTPCHYLNLVSAEFTPVGRGGVRWNDPSLAIEWRLRGDPVLSARDAALPFLPAAG